MNTYGKSVSPKFQQMKYRVVRCNADEWEVYENETLLLCNLSEYQAKAIAAILNR